MGVGAGCADRRRRVTDTMSAADYVLTTSEVEGIAVNSSYVRGKISGTVPTLAMMAPPLTARLREQERAVPEFIPSTSSSDFSCNYCGRPIGRKRRSRDRDKPCYCSKACSGAARHDTGTIETSCAQCGKSLWRIRWQVERSAHSFCDPACHSAFQAGKRTSPDERFDRQVLVLPSGCHQWRGSISPQGYGNFHDGERHVLAHRFAYERAKGAIPAGLQLDHLCRNRWCVNAEHLESVTPQENVLRGEAPSARAHLAGTCQRGHPNAEHAYYRDGVRVYCRTCEEANRRARRGN